MNNFSDNPYQSPEPIVMAELVPELRRVHWTIKTGLMWAIIVSLVVCGNGIAAGRITQMSVAALVFIVSSGYYLNVRRR